MSNPNVICFIICVNDESLYELCLGHIRALIVPPDIKVEVLPVRGALSMASGYNKAMEHNEAKYKVYLHQDVYILNVHFIRDVLAQFHSDEKLGILGLTGAVRMPANGIWWEDSQRCGKVFQQRIIYSYLDFAEVSEANRTVEAVDGMLMVTQYDIPWREDLFDGWHFYDSSQCFEFARHDLRTAVPRQHQYWALHACGNDFDHKAYHLYRQRFVQEYIKSPLF